MVGLDSHRWKEEVSVLPHCEADLSPPPHTGLGEAAAGLAIAALGLLSGLIPSVGAAVLCLP